MPRMYHPNTRTAVLTVAEADVARYALWGYKTLADGENPPPYTSGGGGGSGGPVTAANITDATTLGRSLLTAPNAAVARTAVGAITADDPALTAAAGRELARVTVPRRGLAFIGDSITSFNSTNSHVWHKLLCLLTGQRLRYLAYYATGGHTLEQIEADHLPPVLAMNPLPGACVIAGGTNNVGSAQYNAATSKATHTRIVNALLAAGVMPVLWTIPPRDDSTTVNTEVGRWNAWVRERAAVLGLPLVDAHSALVDPATGRFQTALKLDDVHPNRLGHLAIAQRAAADPIFVGRFADGRPRLTRDIIDGSNLVPSGRGLFLTDSNADGRADNVNAYGTGITHSLIADSGAAGQWQRLSAAAGVAVNAGIQVDVPVTAGRTIALAARIRATLDPATESIKVGLSGQWRNGSGAVAGAPAFTAASDLSSGTIDGVAYNVAVAPATTTTLRVSLGLAGTPTVPVTAEIAQLTVDDLTALGLA